MKQYLVNYEKRLEREICFLDAKEISSKNKSLLLKFKDHNLMNSVSLPRIIRQLGSLRLLVVQIRKDLDKVSRKDIEQFVLWMQAQKYALESIDTHKKIVKVFYRWHNGGEYPDCVKWLKASTLKSTKLPEEMLSEEEVKSLILAALNKRDKALIASLWESGARIGELGTLFLKHVVFDDFGAQIIVDGKTGMRRIRLVSSAPYLLEWINLHPYHDNPNAPLWVNMEKGSGKQTSDKNFSSLLKRAAKRAKIKKPVNPHNFRHSRATYMAQFLTEAQMKEYFGWTKDSNMAARYVHLSGKQVDDAILKMYGLKKEESQEAALKRKPCPRCKTLTDTNHQYCEKCWLPLTQQAINEVTQTQQKDQEAMATVLKLIELAKADPTILREALARTHNLKNPI